jgi:hypothetical protein
MENVLKREDAMFLDDKIAKSWLQEFWKQSEAMEVEGLI